MQYDSVYSGSFRAARLPGQATRAARARLMGGEKPDPPPNCRGLHLPSENSAPSSRKTI